MITRPLQKIDIFSECQNDIANLNKILWYFVDINKPDSSSNKLLEKAQIQRRRRLGRVIDLVSSV